MTLLATPGVYIEPRDPTPQVGDGRDDVAAFVGIAERGPLGLPLAVSSMRQFHSLFGGYLAKAVLAYAVRAFFENGGQLCLVVRVASDEAMVAETRTLLAAGRYGLELSALTPGAWGNRAVVRIEPRSLAHVRAALDGNRRSTPVTAAAGFAPRTLTRLRQGAVEEWGIVSAVDVAARRLHWINPDRERRRPDEHGLVAIDPALPFTVEAMAYDVVVLLDRVPQGVRRALSPVPGHPRDMAALLSDQAARETIPPFPFVARIVEAPLGWGGIPTADGAATALAPSGGVDGLRNLVPADYIAGIAKLEPCDAAILACPDAVARPEFLKFDPLPPEDPCRPCAVPLAAVPTAPAADDDLPSGFSPQGVLAVQMAMVNQCERLRDRVALIDPLAGSQQRGAGTAPVLSWRQQFDTSFAALHHPWVKVPDPLQRRGTRTVPPSGHIAGVLATVTLASGAHRPAAGQDLRWADAPALTLDDARRGVLNEAGVNAMAAGRGGLVRVLGTRSMTSDPTWRMFTVRRLVCAMRRALDRDTRWAVFEPNDAATRLQLFSTIGAWLTRLWRRGALVGNEADQAFRLRCDESNNPEDARANGRLTVDIAFAPAQPLEFIVLRIGREANSFELTGDGGVMPTAMGQAA